MNNNWIRYILTGLVGAIFGAVAALAITKAMPRIMAEMMPVMMENMRGCMNEAGRTPAEL